MSTQRAWFTPFWVGLAIVAGVYVAFLIALLGSMATHTTPKDLWAALAPPPHGSKEPYYIGYSICLSLVSCTVSSLFALLIAVPVGYLLSRGRFAGKSLLDAALDIPIVLPPMVVGLCLLIFFQTNAGKFLDECIPDAMRKMGLDVWLNGRPFPPNTAMFTYTVLGVVLAQFVIGTAFAVRTMRGVFDHLSSRPEDVAMTLGCSRGQAVRMVTLPAARRGMFAAFSIAWARSLGEFGPILVFAGATRMKTEVLSTSVFLELTVGRLEAAIAVSLLMVVLALIVLVAVRLMGERL
jgi:molybdate transport system permease protein